MGSSQHAQIASGFLPPAGCAVSQGCAMAYGVVEGVASVDAEFAGMEGHRQNVGVVADLAEQIFRGILADRPAAGGDDDARHDLAAPARNGNAGSVRSCEPRADRAARESEDHDRIDLLHRERAHACVRLVRARLGVDHFDVPAGGLRGVGRAGDHGDVESIVGDKGDNAEGLRFHASDRGDQRR
jgi:hypothetical protein